MARALATDRLSALSDNVLSTHILSKISYRDAVRFSLLSHRWRFLWKKIVNLNFRCQDFEKQKDDKIRIIISNALLQLDARLCCLDLQVAMDDPNSADMDNWIRLAAEKQVERMTLQICYRDPKSGKMLNDSSMVELGDYVFKCENLINLQLRFINLPKIPTNFGAFRSLKTFYCFNIPNVDDAMFEGFMDVCPHLQNLGIDGCLGLENLNIHSSNLMYLNLGVLSLNISLQVACPRLTEISLMNCGQYQGLKLLQGISRAESVKIITLQNYSIGVNRGVPSIIVLNGFPGLEELTMHGQCFQEMMSDEKPVAQVTLRNLRMVHAHIGLYKGAQAVNFLGFLLRNSPLKVSARVFLPEYCPRIMQNNLLALEKEFSISRLSTATRGWSMIRKVCELCEKHPKY